MQFTAAEQTLASLKRHTYGLTTCYGTTTCGPYTARTNSAIASKTVTGLVNGAACYFVIAARDPNGFSAISAQVYEVTGRIEAWSESF
jgi:hypothetical protein